MTQPRFPLGSEWRRWDLHIHTPFSALNNGFGDDFDRYAKVLFERAIEKQIAAIGVTDYFTIEGYKKLRDLVRTPDRLESLLGADGASQARGILLLPNIEMRSPTLIKRTDGSESRVTFHVIFSDEVSPSTIEEHFLRTVRFAVEGMPGIPDERWPLTLDNLQDLGGRLKTQHAKFRERSDLFVGMSTAVVSDEEVTSVLSQQRSRFEGRFLLIVPADEDLSECSWDGQGHLIRKVLIQKSHMIFSSNAQTREFGLGRKHRSVQEFKNEFKSLKPCVHGSDAHTYDGLFNPAEGRHLWIKADPTFEGLRQLLHEPADRIYVGKAPEALSRRRENATKYVSALAFDRTDHAKPEEVWFSGELALNHGLVAVIGNKGSGKSALADVLGLLGDTRNSAHCSFLNKDRFLHPKTNLGRMFRATVRWHSGVQISRALNDGVDDTAAELVKYLPQNYLETICSELKQSRGSRFDHELMEVIFSHVLPPQRLGRETLPALIDYLTSEKEKRIALLFAEVAKINKVIASLEDQQTDEHRKGLEASLEQRRAELKAHEDAKVAEVPKPSDDPHAQGAMASAKAELASLVDQIRQLDRGIGVAEDGERVAAKQVAAANKLLARIENLERQVENFLVESSLEGEVLGLDVRTLVTLAVDRQPILQARQDAEARVSSLRESLDPGLTGSLAQARRESAARTDAVRASLDEPNRRYEEYLHSLARWEAGRATIEGSPTDPLSVKGLEAKIEGLSQVPGAIADRKRERTKLVREIFDTKQQLLQDYRTLYSPVQTFIDTHPVSQEFRGALQFSASIAVDGLVDGFLEMIHQGRKGSFEGVEDGRQRLSDIATNSDFTTEAGVEAFLENLQHHMDYDRRDDDVVAVRLEDQLRQGKTAQDVYDFVYGLEYLKPRFELRWQGKSLDQLSPGERGNLLLVFYLLIDRREVPLIIDQPEENLDNQTIATMLVPAIKYAKEHRQIFLVTHNANLAVVCDADQIVHCHLDKTDGNRVEYTTGSIEEPAIAQLIVDVLEGTKPAFDLRDSKYELLERFRG